MVQRYLLGRSRCVFRTLPCAMAAFALAPAVRAANFEVVVNPTVDVSSLKQVW